MYCASSTHDVIKSGHHVGKSLKWDLRYGDLKAKQIKRYSYRLLTDNKQYVMYVLCRFYDKMT